MTTLDCIISVYFVVGFLLGLVMSMHDKLSAFDAVLVCIAMAICWAPIVAVFGLHLTVEKIRRKLGLG